MKHLQRDLIDQERLKEFLFAHPSLTPDRYFEGILCVNPPSVFGSTAKLEAWRETVRAYCAKWPDAEHWPYFLNCVINALEWRETVPPEYRFWKPELQ